MSNNYTTVAGTEPSTDEQHEARTIRRDRQEGSYMMTEIGDGTFVQWSDCLTCKNPIELCRCANGPTEPGYIARWRLNRFVDSFKGRGVDPALPEVMRDRDRRVNAVIRHLLDQGYKIEAPDDRLEVPDFNEDRLDTSPVDLPTAYDPEGPDGWIKDKCEFCGAESGQRCLNDKGGELHEPHTLRERAWSARRAYEKNPQDYQGPIKPEWTATPDVVSEKVDAGMDNALETLRARVQEDKSDPGF